GGGGGAPRGMRVGFPPRGGTAPADRPGALLPEPLRGGHADARVAPHVARIVLAPQAAPPGIDDDGVTWLEAHVLPLKRLLEVLHGYLVLVVQDVYALEPGHVDQDPARHQRADLLDAQLGEARARGDLVGLEAVVVAVLDRLVGEAVELRADLPDFAGEQLLVAPAPVGLRVHDRALGVNVVLARGLERHGRGELVPELDRLARL